MVSSYSPNINLEEPARGDQVGTWDTPVNNNMTLLDLVVGGRTTISLNNSPVVLAAAQFQCKTITFNSTLTGSVAITFPSTFTKSYEIYNSCTGSSAFVVTLQTTVAGGAFVCAPPGEYCTVLNTGTGIVFTNLDRIGSYWDYAGSSVPAWVSGCNPLPYLNCDGSTFSATTYPQLAVILGSTTLPDSRARARVPKDQGAGRLSSAVAGFGPDTVRDGGGSQSVTLTAAQLPASIPYTDPGHTHIERASPAGGAGGIIISNVSGVYIDIAGVPTGSATTGITINPSGGGLHTNIQPTYIGGLTLIRAG